MIDETSYTYTDNHGNYYLAK